MYTENFIFLYSISYESIISKIFLLMTFFKENISLSAVNLNWVGINDHLAVNDCKQ